ncbi:MAG: hypothetical protein VKK63_08515 [Synechococcus sp.]|nr:hypothetical protein [Synechococcus sp.]
MTASFKVDAGGFTIRHTEDQLLSLVAAFIVEGKPGATLVLPSLASLRKAEDGRIIMKNLTVWGSVSTRLHNETSDDIVARIKRWSRAL